MLKTGNPVLCDFEQQSMLALLESYLHLCLTFLDVQSIRNSMYLLCWWFSTPKWKVEIKIISCVRNNWQRESGRFKSIVWVTRSVCDAFFLANKSVPCRSASLAWFCLVYVHSTAAVTSGTRVSKKNDPTRKGSELLSMVPCFQKFIFCIFFEACT